MATSKDKFCRDDFCLVCCIRIDVVKVFKLCQHCRPMAADVFEKLFHSQSVSLQHVDSQTGRCKGGRSSALQNSFFRIKDSLPFGLNSLNHWDSFSPLSKMENLVS